MATTRRVIVLCDGTWCGRETNTKSNIHFLAKMIGVDLRRNPAEYTSSTGNVCARYFDRVGLGWDIMSHLWNGAFATQAKKECTEVYKFIVENLAWDPQVHTEVWMFGISRGASIVRSVAGMINNCGIIKDKTKEGLIKQVYDLYRSPHTVNQPWSAEMIEFRKRVSHQLSNPPVKFMGMFDTVGSRGVPKLNYHTGTGFEWPEFYNTKVSSEYRGIPNKTIKKDLKIHQKWLPGCHYDLARQEFQFLREGGSTLEKVLFPILNKISKTVSPNEQLADLVLLWMLESINKEGGGAIIQQDMAGKERNITTAIPNIKEHITSGRNGTGDMYAHIPSYLPGGKTLSVLIAWFENLNETAYAILFNPVDRVIPDPGKNNSTQAAVYNEVYNYTVADSNIGKDVIIGTSTDVIPVPEQPLRYPSQTYWNYRTYVEAVERPA
ncbi:hypothetical protein K469DRAFT_747105 [Zopfia rhizophila CBS 207.26]|uniref:T6SS Phospholipase effector Tle1-like catalytic domain-containing protein n=1 Tax=Zopfia rhizophila CBS 207.26 TaxID=1314779 RepID=A0A6A6EJ19_9PEZI|nr:hypothetical protein K469DRAFT_747105 [Zopfia rhizophila CBS 207.26]